MKTRIAIVSLLAVMLLAACAGKGVSGKVTGGDGKPIAGASVELKCTGCATSSQAKTGSDGRYSFPDAGAGNYVLTIVWDNPPACPGITPFETLGKSGDFLITFAGYGGIGGTGSKRVIAVVEFELKGGKTYNLKIACPGK